MVRALVTCRRLSGHMQAWKLKYYPFIHSNGTRFIELTTFRFPPSRHPFFLPSFLSGNSWIWVRLKFYKCEKKFVTTVTFASEARKFTPEQSFVLSDFPPKVTRVTRVISLKAVIGGLGCVNYRIVFIKMHQLFTLLGSSVISCFFSNPRQYVQGIHEIKVNIWTY